MSMITLEKTLTGIAMDIFKVMKETALNTNGTPADVARLWNNLDKVGRTSNQKAVDEIRTQVKDAVNKHMVENGFMHTQQADLWFETYWPAVQRGVSHAEGIRNYNREYNSMTARAKRLVRRMPPVLGGIAVAGFILALIVSPSTSTAPSMQEQIAEAIQKDALQPSQIQNLTVTTDQFNLMIGGLVAQSAPTSPVPVPAIPEVFAAVEAEPLTVEVTTPTGKQQITTTVRQFYQSAAPQVRQEMEMPKIDHGYDHEDLNDCFHRHCLTPHKDFTVATDFASAHIKY